MARHLAEDDRLTVLEFPSGTALDGGNEMHHFLYFDHVRTNGSLLREGHIGPDEKKASKGFVPES